MYWVCYSFHSFSEQIRFACFLCLYCLYLPSRPSLCRYRPFWSVQEGDRCDRSSIVHVLPDKLLRLLIFRNECYKIIKIFVLGQNSKNGYFLKVGYLLQMLKADGSFELERFLVSKYHLYWIKSQSYMTESAWQNFLSSNNLVWTLGLWQHYSISSLSWQWSCFRYAPPLIFAHASQPLSIRKKLDSRVYSADSRWSASG